MGVEKKMNNIKVTMLDQNLDVMTREFNIIHALPLINVLQVVGERAEQEGYDELRRDVEKNGFTNPIVIIKNTPENYKLAIRQVTKELVNRYVNAHRTYLCMYGNQRVDIALNLRIFHLDAIIADNVEWAHAIQLKLDTKSFKPNPLPPLR